MGICLILYMEKDINFVGRPQKCRFVKESPSITYFKPRGIPMSELEVVEITVDEFEAIRLADNKELYQSDAAKKMGISRQTFGRIITSARKKISQGLIQGKAIKIDGGNYEIRGKKMKNSENMGSIGECICPKCKKEIDHKRGVPCHQEKCPDCGTKMLRKNSKHYNSWLQKQND